MNFLRCGVPLLASLLYAGNPQQTPTTLNVNSRYTVESVEIAGESESRMSHSLRHDLKNLVGEKLNPTALDDLGSRIRKELHVHVKHRVTRGRAPEHVKVIFELSRHNPGFEVSVPKFLYHSKEGWSGAVEGATTIAMHNTFTAGVVSDGDEIAERYAGLYARYENNKIGSNRVRMSFQFASFHEQWNRATLRALDRAGTLPGIYRTRQDFSPVVMFSLARPLTLSVGASFERFQTQFPAARTEAANAVVTTLRYHRRLEDSDANQHELDAGYSLRAATRVLSSDFAYARHRFDLRYKFSRGHHSISCDGMAGVIGGKAPLFERFVLGTGSTLRGWNKYDVDPVGGTLMAHNSLEYRYRIFQIFYDTGAVSNHEAGDSLIARHSIGLGLRKGGFTAAVAFPVKDGRAEPMFMLGMNIN